MQTTGGSKTNGNNTSTNGVSKLSKLEPKLERRSKIDCLKRMWIDPKSKTAKMLEPPEGLFLINDSVEPSFTSDPEKTLEHLALVFQRRGKEEWDEEVPQEVLAALPDYGLDLRGDGNQAYLLLVDKSRKVIVRAEVNNLWSGKPGLQLGSFEYALGEALKIAQRGIRQNGDFEFVFTSGFTLPRLFTKESARLLF